MTNCTHGINIYLKYYFYIELTQNLSTIEIVTIQQGGQFPIVPF